MADDRTADDVYVGAVVATVTARGLTVRRRRFTHVPTLVRATLWVMLAFGVGVGTFAPFAFALVCILASVAGMFSFFVDGAERAIRPWLLVIRRDLEVTRTVSTDGTYREGALAQSKVVVDGRELRGRTREVRVQRRKAERGNAVGYPIYLVHDDAIVEIAMTADADDARRLRWILRHELGLEQTGGAPAQELPSFAVGCWMALLGVPFLLGAISAGVWGTLSAKPLVGVDRLALLAALAVGVSLLEIGLALLLGLVARSPARRWIEESFGFVPGG